MSGKAPLFSDFPPLVSKAWKQQIQYELKGADYNETLIWNSPEGIRVKPFYHGDEDVPAYEIPAKAPGFLICQDIFVFDVAKSAIRALDSLKRGAETIRFILPEATVDLEGLLGKFPFRTNELHLRLEFLSVDFLKRLDALASKHDAVIHCEIDPIRHLAKDGNWYACPEKDNFKALSSAITQTKRLALLSVDATTYQNAGANIVQQLAYALAHTNDYFNRLDDTGHPLTVHFAIGSNYFFEIAKLRAFRLLYAALAKAYGRDENCRLFAVPTRRNKTLYDYNVNMLRTTSECMAAIAGGADLVANLPYDAIYHKSNEFGERIARNQLLILKNESHFDAASNPADGSHYLESLTAQLAEKALALFKEIEAGGGLLEAFKEGTIQRKIRESADKEQQAFDSGAEILLGTNKYPNPSDRMQDELQLFPFVKVQQRKTLITPLIEKRLAEKAEQQRLATEKPTEP